MFVVTANAAPLDPRSSNHLKTLLRVTEELRKLDGEIQAQTVAILLLIADKPDIQMRQIEAATGLTSSSVSRNVALLGPVHRRGMPGLDLVVAYEDAEDRRFKRVKLSSAGERFISRILHLMGA